MPKPDWLLKTWKTIPCLEPGCKKPIEIDIVDEDKLEASDNPDFVEGDNWLHDQQQTDHPKYVPDHHILLSSLIFKEKGKPAKTLAHELAEIVAEDEGMPYDEAHEEIANPVEESVARHRAPRVPWR
jgi:hypothetical protein